MSRLAVWAVLIAAAWGVGAAPARAVPQECTCATTRATNGWCPLHEFGYVGGVKVTSRWLYEFVDAHGHELDLSTFTCPTCKIAIATNGFCETHHLGFVDKLAYYSRLTYELGKAELRPDGTISCARCRKNAETHGWCAKSAVGMVGPFAIRDRREFDRAVAALDLFVVADEAARRCRYCAGAIMTNSECPACRIAYKDGKVVARAP